MPTSHSCNKKKDASFYLKKKNDKKMRNTQSQIVRKTTKESVKSVTHIINQIVRASLTRKRTSGLSIPILRRQSHATRSEKDWFDENTDIGIKVKVSKKC